MLNRFDYIEVQGARNNNLCNVSVKIPKYCITVFTGVSGSGKSSLVFDTIAAESQRQLNESYSAFIRHRLPHYGRANVDFLGNLPASIIIDQKAIGTNVRSTVGTITDIQPLLRLLFSRAGQPFVGYSNIFSFNHLQGMCTNCQGLGMVDQLDIDLLFDKNKSLNEGAIQFPTFAPTTFRWQRYVLSGLFDCNKKLKDYSNTEWQTLLYADNIVPAKPLSGWPKTAKFQGVVPRFHRAYLDHQPSRLTRNEQAALKKVVVSKLCVHCHGKRLNNKILSCEINHKSIADCAEMDIEELLTFIKNIKQANIASVVAAIIERLEQMIAIGLAYLSLARATSSLSGGESQRVKILRHLGSSLSDIVYIFDEPSVGLHPKDIHQLNILLCKLRDKGNTVLVIEHDPQIIAIADHIIDMGPYAGDRGGQVVYQGDYKGLLAANTVTGNSLLQKNSLNMQARSATGQLVLENVSLYNLHNVTVSIPMGVLTVVTGVAGSGKTTLVKRLLTNNYPEAILLDQTQLRGSRRSSLCSYIGVLEQIRSIYAKESHLPIGLFSNNGAGACILCKGLGIIKTDLAFMDDVEIACDACNATGFNAQARAIIFQGYNIAQIMTLTVNKAINFFNNYAAISGSLNNLLKVGLGYITLGQRLNTLSGGERQRLKLAQKLHLTGCLYIFDEPTSGLHMADVAKLLQVFAQLLTQGHTIITVEHNLDVIAKADWIVEMGPGAGKSGGKIIYQGTVNNMLKNTDSITGSYLKKYIFNR